MLPTSKKVDSKLSSSRDVTFPLDIVSYQHYDEDMSYFHTQADKLTNYMFNGYVCKYPEDIEKTEYIFESTPLNTKYKLS